MDIRDRLPGVKSTRSDSKLGPISALARWLAGVVVVDGLLLVLLAWIIPGFRFEDPGAIIPTVVTIAIVESLLQLVYSAASRVSPWLFPFLSFVLTGAGITFATWLNDRVGIGGVEVADLWTGMLVSVGLTAGNTVLAAIFSLDDDRAYDRFVTPPLRFSYRDTPQTSVPGFLFSRSMICRCPSFATPWPAATCRPLPAGSARGATRCSAGTPISPPRPPPARPASSSGRTKAFPPFAGGTSRDGRSSFPPSGTRCMPWKRSSRPARGCWRGEGPGGGTPSPGNAVENIGVYSVFGDAERGSGNTLLGYLLTPYMVTRILTLLPDRRRSRVVAGVATATPHMSSRAFPAA